MHCNMTNLLGQSNWHDPRTYILLAIVLAALKLLFKQNHISKVLVVAPLRVCFSTWPGEIQKWADFNHLRVVILHGDMGNKDELLEQEALFLERAERHFDQLHSLRDLINDS